MRFRFAAAAALVVSFVFVAFAAPAAAQLYTGAIDVVVQDSSGGSLSGVAVSIGGSEGQTQTTDDTGHAHIVNLQAGMYSIHMTHAGLAPQTISSIVVESGSSTAVSVRMTATAPAEAGKNAPITPVVDPRSIEIITHISADEVQSVPRADDPWSLLATVPSVYVDRVNVGGSESNEQAAFSGKGAAQTDNTWAIDGVPVNDTGDTLARPELSGSSPFYVDVNGLQELAVRTGGADVRAATGGVLANVVLRHGDDAPHGSARFVYSSPRFQGSNISADLTDAIATTAGGRGNRTDKYQDYGFDLGGPLLKDSIWVWGTIANTAVNLLTLNGLADNTSLSYRGFKADARWIDGVRGHFTYYDNEKTEAGRSAGPTRPLETTWQQSGPSTFYKGEGTFSTTRRLFASVRGAFVDAGVNLTPNGGLAKDYYIDDAGVVHNSYFAYQTTRPQHFYGGDANYFLGANELTFGGSWRTMAADTLQTWPGSHLVAAWQGYPNMLVQATRDYHAVTSARYITAFAADTLALDRLTLTAGVRFDRQTSSLGAATVPAVTGFETVLPAAAATPIANVFKWSNLAPRLAVDYAIDGSRKTVVRATYAMFASQLQGSLAEFVSPIQYADAFYNGVDRNGDGVAQPAEVQVAQGLQGFSGFDPRNPSSSVSVNRADPGTKAPKTQEITAGFERQLAPAFGVSATFTWRRMTDLLWTPLAGVTQASYAQVGAVSGNVPEVGAFSVPVFAPRASGLPPGDGKVLTNRPGYHQQFTGLEIAATRRLAQRWNARVAFSANKWREYFDNPAAAILDPTPAPAASTIFPFAGPQVNGGSVMQLSDVSGSGSVYMAAPGYQFAASGTYAARWGIDLAASVVSRQGYAEPFFVSNVAGDPLGRKSVLIVPAADQFRLPSVTRVDLRLGKGFTFSGSRVAIDVDVFNLLNSGTILSRQYDARLIGATGFGQTLEVMNPRIARINLRFTF